MNTLKRYMIRAVFCTTILLLIRCSMIYSQSFRLFGVSDLYRVFEDGYRLPPMADSIKLNGIRGEVISGQLAVYAKKAVDNVMVDVSALKNQVSSAELPAKLVEWNFVGSVPLAANTPNQPPDVLSRIVPARFPEYLMAEKQISLKAKSYRSIWITVSIPEDAKSGTYIGKITVKGKSEVHSLPVSIQVYPLSMPPERHLKVIEWHNLSGFEKFHGISAEYSKEWFDMLKKYADNMVSHRQNIFQVPMDVIGIIKNPDGKLEFDFARFDQIADVFWGTGKMDMLETGFLANFGKGDWFSTEILLKDFTAFDSNTGAKITLSGNDVVPLLIPQFERHLRQKGWLDKTLFHVRDEPSVHNALAWKDLSEYFHKYGPDLIRGDAIETTFLLDAIEIACPKLDHLATWYQTYKEWAEKGGELWFYTVGIYQGSRFPDKTIDMPLIDSRLMHWLNYKYDAVGYLHWGYNQWDDDPFNKIGEHVGDGWHVYPSKNGVLNSLRWEEMRNGIQDYEYLWMLENKIRELKDSLGSRFSWIDPKQRGKEIADRVVKTFADHTDDAKVLYKARTEIIRELLTFSVSPRIYFQTNPPENSTLTEHSTAEVYGWTEPGTRIVLNGKEVPVDRDGLFLEQCGGDFIDSLKFHLGNRITVQATGSSGVKTIVRDFTIR